MNDNNAGNGSGKVIDFMTKKGGGDSPRPTEPGEYEIHLHAMGAPNTEGVLPPAEVVTAKGFLKFGPQFIAVIEGNEDTSPVVLAVSTPAVKFVKKIGLDGETEATLSP